MQLKPMRLFTPAKINTILRILSKHEDGFHEIFTHMVPISFFDELTLQEHSMKHFSFRCNLRELEGPENLVWRALKLFEEASGRTVRLIIHLQKRIPTGGGLGGGSGNAAATLLALNRWYDEPLAEKELEELGEQLGSDVPFFLNPSPTMATGRGNILRSLQNYPLGEILLVIPTFSISTAKAYGMCKPKMYNHPSTSPTTITELASKIENQFHESLFSSYPELNQICELLLELGALAAAVSGSGSTVFGLFDGSLERNFAMTQLQEQTDYTLIPCKMLNSHNYFSQQN
jgi:4-diphosphocytidyl-2-C-methyl-D-erythritol kinase